MQLNTNALYSYISFDNAEAIVERAMDGAETIDEVIENLYQAIDDEMIYTDDQWELMKYYMSPDEADLETAFEYLYNDLVEAIEGGAIEDDEEDEEDDDEDLYESIDVDDISSLFD